MDPLTQTRLLTLMSLTSGHRDIAIGVIDGPVDLHHAAFKRSVINTVKDSQISACTNASDMACTHGTFIAGILCAKRGLFAPAICPDCKIILNPVFGRARKNNTLVPTTTPEELSNAIVETVNAGAKIINLSLGLSASSVTSYDKLKQAYDYALRKEVIIVVSAGNQGNIGNTPLINHHWIIPVAGCDENGRLDPMSNFGSSIGSRGLMAPSMNIRSTYPGGQYTYMSGTSFAAAFVTATIALLWSMFRKASAAKMIYSLRLDASPSRRSIIPPLLDAKHAWERLRERLPLI